MRFLNKIIFINSATIKYADIQIDGNVHFIGIQGVGKSTLLRAILFFYNADSLKLGISKEKKNFAEYYFPFQNSFLVFEVVRETGPFCIMAFKSQGKVCFRFIDSGFNRKYFISEDGKAFENWDATRALLDVDRIFYSRKIDRYEEYRDILYGNNEGKKDFGKYALMQSRHYQNIPRTIQNVFLNSKLEAEFIKQTIIMSLNEEDIQIDLLSYTHHLKSFDEQLADISQFKQPVVLKQVDQAIKHHLAIRHLEKEKIILARQLAWSVQHIKFIIPELYERKETKETQRLVLNEKLQDAEKRFYNKRNKIQAEISVLEDKLKSARQKEDEYAQMNIQEIVTRVSKKKEFESEYAQFIKEKELLTEQFAEVAQKYTSLLLLSENGLREILYSNNLQKLESNQEAFDSKEKASQWLQQGISEIKLQQQQELEQARETADQKKQALHQLSLRKEGLRHQRFLEDELGQIAKVIQTIQLAIPQAENSMKHEKAALAMIQQQWELDEKTVRQLTDRNIEKITEQVTQDKVIIGSIDNKLQSSSTSLYGWLNEHAEGWESNIGKVCSEEVLFHSDLSPRKDIQAGTSLYGIHVNLDELTSGVKTVADYEADKSAALSHIEEMNRQLTSLQTQQQNELEKLRKKYQSGINEIKNTIKELEYTLEQNNTKLQQAQIQLKDTELSALTEKQSALKAIDEAIHAAAEDELQAIQQFHHLKGEVEKLVKSKEREYDKKILSIEQQLKRSLENIRISTELAMANHEDRKKEIFIQQAEELAGTCADTSRLNIIEHHLQELKSALNYIESKVEIVYGYKKDKAELLDKAALFKTQKSLLEQQQEQEEKKYQLQKDKLHAELTILGEDINHLQQELSKAEEDISAFTNFQLTEAYQSIPGADKEENELYKTGLRCIKLIADFNECYYKIIRRLDDLKESCTKFIGNFSSRNIFNFPSSLVEKQQFLAFAEQLNEFMNDSKIEEFERRVNERFATIIHSLGKETDILLSKGGEIQKVINNINKDFESKNFVGAIQKIELRLDDSVNRVVQLLVLIRKFNIEHAYDLGGINLFSSVDQETKNRKAIDLLKQLGKVISEYKSDHITLSDSFELKFRIEENQNDTGWVERLSNVGSEGTDVLVKAMINIMLLNVFKEGASRRFKDFRLHCMMDEIGKLHPNNIKGILQFANDRNILLTNGSPTENNAMNYRHIYKLEKDEKRFTKVKRIITNYAQS